MRVLCDFSECLIEKKTVQHSQVGISSLTRKMYAFMPLFSRILFLLTIIEWYYSDDGKYDSDLRTTLDGSSTESDQGRGGSEAGSFIGSPAGVDPLVVNFEEGMRLY